MRIMFFPYFLYSPANHPIAGLLSSVQVWGERDIQPLGKEE